MYIFVEMTFDLVLSYKIEQERKSKSLTAMTCQKQGQLQQFRTGWLEVLLQFQIKLQMNINCFPLIYFLNQMNSNYYMLRFLIKYNILNFSGLAKQFTLNSNLKNKFANYYQLQLYTNCIFMGHCLSKTTIIKKDFQEQEPFAHASRLNKGRNTFQIEMLDNEKTILFRNAPLINCNFLFDKFHHENNVVEKINLEWKVLNVKSAENRLKVEIISLVTVKMWIIIGGLDFKSITGVYTKVQDYEFADWVLIQEQKRNGQTKFYDLKVPQLNKYPKIRIILESVANKSQSIWLINSYSFSNTNQIKLERQQLMWNNLAFQIENIYNQKHQNEQQFIESDIECVICTEETANCILLPCKHMCIGKNCLANFRRSCKFCPLCKKQFNQLICC